MNGRAQSLHAWRTMASRIGEGQPSVTIPKIWAPPHPLDAGARLTTTWPVGQLADFALELEAGVAPLLIREFSDRYEVFVASVQLTQQLVRLIESNSAVALGIGGVLIGGSLGAALARSREGALLGACLGLIAAAIIQSRLIQRPQA